MGSVLVASDHLPRPESKQQGPRTARRALQTTCITSSTRRASTSAVLVARLGFRSPDCLATRTRCFVRCPATRRGLSSFRLCVEVCADLGGLPPRGRPFFISLALLAGEASAWKA